MIKRRFDLPSSSDHHILSACFLCNRKWQKTLEWEIWYNDDSLILRDIEGIIFGSSRFVRPNPYPDIPYEVQLLRMQTVIIHKVIVNIKLQQAHNTDILLSLCVFLSTLWWIRNAQVSDLSSARILFPQVDRSISSSSCKYIPILRSIYQQRDFWGYGANDPSPTTYMNESAEQNKWEMNKKFCSSPIHL